MVGAKLCGGFARNLPLAPANSAQLPGCNRGDSRAVFSDLFACLPSFTGLPRISQS